MKTVLVVDDERRVRNQFVLALADLPCKVLSAGSGEEGLDVAKGRGVDLVFLDLEMPGLDGIQTLEQLQKQPGQADVYLLSAFTSECLSKLRHAVEKGLSFEVLRKPIKRDEIRSVGDDLLRAPS